MDFLPKELESYASAHTTPESEILYNISRETRAKVLMPRMLSGHLQGRAIALFSKMIKPDTILEIGTYTGYSAICLAEGLTEKGKLITIDINEELKEMVNQFINKAGMKDKISILTGDAMKIIPTLNETFDLVFIDADKVNYLNYYKLVFNKVKQGGFILADNVLWSGKVIDDKCKDEDTKAIRDFNDFIQNDERVENCLLPIRDGILLIRKK